VHRVRTELFIQVDADMILDRHCVEDLRHAMTPDVGVVQGPLADPLMGALSGVRMFRTACVQEVAFRDTIAPDTDFFQDIVARGWERRVVLSARTNDRALGLWHTFGRHEPLYTPFYTYYKFLVLGARYRHRRDLAGVHWRLRELDRGRLPVALIAQLALAHGIFLDATRDLVMPCRPTAEFEHLERLLARGGRTSMRDADILRMLSQPAEEQFREFCQLGSRLSGERDGGGIRLCVELLQGVPLEQAWLARVGLGHGLFLEHTRPDQLGREYAIAQELRADGGKTAPFRPEPTRHERA